MSPRKNPDKSSEKKPSATVRGQAKTGIKNVPQPDTPFVVGIGASAGGLEAFERFFRAVAAESGLVFILVPHLDPNHHSLLPELLGKYTQMTIIPIEEKMALKPNHVYVVPPNKLLRLEGGKLRLDKFSRQGEFLPVDHFFRSLAADQKEKSIGVILSGSGRDGVIGCREIRAHGGVVAAQKPESAKYDSMPQSIIDAELADFILPPEEIPARIEAYASGMQALSPIEKVLTPDEVDGTFKKILRLLQQHTGNDFSGYKPSTLHRRVERRMMTHQVKTLSEYMQLLEQHPGELDTLFGEITINVTSFFRDPDLFILLKKQVLPALLGAQPPGARVRVWVPGCSTGEESYSLAMILQEIMDETGHTQKLQIFGTDIDANAIRKAREGIYHQSLMTGVSQERLERFFLREEESYRIKKDIREMLVFAPQNMISDPPFTKLDMICCRNVFIYLEGALQKRILPLFHYSLNPGGILVLGSSESIGEFMDIFEEVDHKWRIFRKKPADVARDRLMVNFPVRSRKINAPVADRMEVFPLPDNTTIKMIERVLLEEHTPPCAVVNQEGDISWFHGHTGKYLEPAPGAARLNIIDMARPGLRAQIGPALIRAVTGKQPVLLENVKIPADGETLSIDVTVKPLLKPAPLKENLLVVFDHAHAAPERPRGKKPREQQENQEIEALRQELQFTKENLHSTIEEMETSREVLTSTNEELQSTNEELMSTNEEMETSKEELQSLNEEMITVNAELENRIEEFTRANDDMRNLLDSTEIATLFLDRDLRIKRFTPKATMLFHLVAGDIGRPIGHFTTTLKYSDLEADISRVLKKLTPIDAQVRGDGDKWFNVRITPYRTITDAIDGVVITLTDITETKAAEIRATEAQIYAQNIVETITQPMAVLTAGEHRVISANNAFYKLFGVAIDEVEEHLLDRLGNRQWNIPELEQALHSVSKGHSPMEGFRVEHVFPGIGKKTMLLNARQVIQEEGRRRLILLAIEDVTVREASEKGHE